MDHLLDEQIAYYRARAAEYDQWWLRQGRYDQGPELAARWGLVAITKPHPSIRSPCAS